MENKRFPLLVILFMASILFVHAYKMRVYVRDAVGTRLKCKSIYATDKNNIFIEDGEYCSQDTSFVFKSLPENPIFIKTTIDNETEDLWVENQDAPQDTLYIDLPVDYTSVQLAEVTVNADSHIITDSHTVYRPNSRQKRSSHDASGLLLSMNIPELMVNPVSRTVTTLSGEDVSYFIDYIPATAAQLENLRTSDVKSVQIYEAPSDPVFLGKRNVVNFILVKYEYGGYGKISASQFFVTPLTNYSLSSRTSFRNFIFDYGVNGQYSVLRHSKRTAEKTLRFGENTLRWNETDTYKNSPRDSELAYIMMAYGRNNFSMTHTLGLSHSDNKNKSESDISYESPIMADEIGRQSQDSRSMNPYWMGNFQFILPRRWDLTVEPSVSYGNNRYDYCYSAEGASIANNAREHTWLANIHLQSGKSFGKGHRVGFMLYGSTQSFKIDYTGTTPAEVNSKEKEVSFTPNLALNFGKFRIYTTVGIGWLRSSINSDSQTDLMLRYFFSGNYNISPCHRISVSSQLNYVVIPMSQRSPNLVIQNNLEAKEGNPALKPTIYTRQMFQYLTFPTSWLSLSAFGRIERHTRAVALVVDPRKNGKDGMMIVSGAENSGFQNIATVGLGSTFSLLSDKLTIGLNVSYKCMRRHGIQNMSDDFMTFSAHANYYLGDFYIQPFYSHSAHTYSNVAIAEHPSTYQVSLGWSNGNLNISAAARNFFSFKLEEHYIKNGERGIHIRHNRLWRLEP